MTLISTKTVICMDIGKKYSWCETISTGSGKVLKEFLTGFLVYAK